VVQEWTVVAAAQANTVSEAMSVPPIDTISAAINRGNRLVS
jgi:hypothetical protein